jgi:hypothetical protein
MKNTMATRVQKGDQVNPGECTQFQLHKTQQTSFSNSLRYIYDFSEYRLLRCIELAEDQKKKSALISLLQDYIQGLIAVAWRSGQPVCVKITKE